MKNDAGTKLIKALIRKWVAAKNELPTLLGNEAVNHFKNNFRLQGFEDSGVQAWKPRKKSDTGRATLVKSGNLRRSIRIAYATWAKTSIISDLPYSAIHNYGGNAKAWGKHPFRMEQRKYMGMSHTLNKKSLLLIRKKTQEGILKVLYTDIKTRLEALTSLQYVALWNNQFDRSNNETPEGNTEQAFPYPCSFIHFFGDNFPTSGGGGAKRLEVDIRIYIGFESYNLDPTEVFDLAAEVQEQLQDWHTSNFTPLQYMAQRMDYNHNNVIVYEFEFKTQFSDNTKYFKRNTITKAAPTDLNLTVNLDIDNQIIRTGDGA